MMNSIVFHKAGLGDESDGNEKEVSKTPREKIEILVAYGLQEACVIVKTL